MNWLDILLIIIASLVLIGSLAILIYLIVEQEVGFGLVIFASGLFITFMFGLLPFMVIDKASGSTIGLITSVDKNFFGTTSLYIKTSETTQEIYCIENEDIVNQSKELIGKEVKIEYGTRVGLYSTGKCHQAPLEKIEERGNK